MVEQQGSSIYEERTWTSVDYPSAASGAAGLPPIERIGEFRIIREIRPGGMGIVFEALRDNPPQPVAIKLLKHSFITEEQRERFLREIRTLALLSHQNIVKFFDVGELEIGREPLPYYVMELVHDAKSITSYARDNKLTTDQRIDLFLQCCGAMEYSHKNNVLHRDLKPSNIVVDGTGQVKVIDFGVARKLMRDDDTVRYTGSDQRLGTPQYMSPEQVRAHATEPDQRSDVYSLGAVLYELLTKRLPYEVANKSYGEAERVICEVAPRRPTAVAPELSQDVESIILKTLSKDRDKRYQSVAALQRELKRYRNGQPLTEHEHYWLYLTRHHIRQFFRRHKLATAALTLLIVTLIAEFFIVPIAYRWTSVNTSYTRWLGGMEWLQPPMVELTDVRIITMTDETELVVAEIGQELGLADVDPAQWKSLRLLHGEVMKRLADAGPRVLAYDIPFDGETEFDHAMVKGLNALKEAKIPVVFLMKTWGADDDGTVNINPEFFPHVRFGAAIAGFDASAPWEIELLTYRPSYGILDSFALTILTAYWHPDANYIATFDPAKDAYARIDFYKEDEKNPQLRLKAGPAREIPLSSTWPLEEDDPEFNLKAGDFQGFYAFNMPSDERLEAASIDFEWILRAEPAALRAAVQDKILILGDFSSYAPDMFAHPDGRTQLSGCYGQAVAVQSLLSGAVVLDEREILSRTVIPIAAFLGLLIGWFGVSNPARQFLLLGALALLLIVCGLVAFRSTGVIFNPIVPFLGALLACALSARIVQSRRGQYA